MISLKQRTFYSVIDRIIKNERTHFCKYLFDGLPDPSILNELKNESFNEIEYLTKCIASIFIRYNERK